jgi:hypothetical protein
MGLGNIGHSWSSPPPVQQQQQQQQPAASSGAPAGQPWPTQQGDLQQHGGPPPLLPHHMLATALPHSLLATAFASAPLGPPPVLPASRLQDGMAAQLAPEPPRTSQATAARVRSVALHPIPPPWQPRPALPGLHRPAELTQALLPREPSWQVQLPAVSLGQLQSGFLPSGFLPNGLLPSVGGGAAGVPLSISAQLESLYSAWEDGNVSFDTL